MSSTPPNSPSTRSSVRRSPGRPNRRPLGLFQNPNDGDNIDRLVVPLPLNVSTAERQIRTNEANQQYNIGDSNKENIGPEINQAAITRENLEKQETLDAIYNYDPKKHLGGKSKKRKSKRIKSKKRKSKKRKSKRRKMR
jgi:hypothetical protein